MSVDASAVFDAITILEEEGDLGVEVKELHRKLRLTGYSLEESHSAFKHLLAKGAAYLLPVNLKVHVRLDPGPSFDAVMESIHTGDLG